MSKQEPVIALMVAIGENGAIGRGGDLPWRLSTDLRYFRKVTLGKPIIMGRRTFESFGRPLDGRLNIVLTRNAAFDAPGTVPPIVWTRRSMSRAKKPNGPAPMRS